MFVGNTINETNLLSGVLKKAKLSVNFFSQNFGYRKLCKLLIEIALPFSELHKTNFVSYIKEKLHHWYTFKMFAKDNI